jgi:hypothetical protein
LPFATVTFASPTSNVERLAERHLARREPRADLV